MLTTIIGLVVRVSHCTHFAEQQQYYSAKMYISTHTVYRQQYYVVSYGSA